MAGASAAIELSSSVISKQGALQGSEREAAQFAAAQPLTDRLDPGAAPRPKLGRSLALRRIGRALVTPISKPQRSRTADGSRTAKAARRRPCSGHRLAERKFGGARRDRTADLLNAIQALSQLSYGPTLVRGVGMNRGNSRRRSSARLYSRLVGRTQASSSSSMSPSIRSETSSSPSSSSSRKFVVRHVLGDVDVLVDRKILFGLARLDFLERHQFRPRRLDLGLVVVGHDRRAGGDRRRDTAERRGLEDGAAFRAGRRVLVEVVEFCAAAHALAL